VGHRQEVTRPDARQRRDRPICHEGRRHLDRDRGAGQGRTKKPNRPITVGCLDSPENRKTVPVAAKLMTITIAESTTIIGISQQG
jgi:hypothetical protein